ncbi:hypothetical protein A9G24_08935 [Gilliamella sp. App6-5]|uniref:hypothetical protein n=1 Tax=Gilliamella sp. App6-5 TaxID=3120232 RepID=UPI00080E96D8|nr:hypothetical protein [Gilliamella apicola]OCG12237.1 hypothetical protein A9G24_08935 [Gilliamella apicola]
MNIKNFLETGSYLGLKVGLSEQALYAILPPKVLGKKHYFDESNKDEGFSYFYHAIEIMIIEAKIYSLGVDVERSSLTFFNDFTINANSSFELILKYLDIANIAWQFEQQYCYQREITIKTQGNVLLGCVYDKGDYRLSKFKVFE